MIIGPLLSPTRALIDMFKSTSTSDEERGDYIRQWVRYSSCIDVMVLAFLITLEAMHIIVYDSIAFLLICYGFSKCNEIVYAFYRDAFRIFKNSQETSSNLKPHERIAMAMQSYLTLIICFALLYKYIPITNFFEKPFETFIDTVYFSLASITTLGHDITPTHWFAKLLIIYQVLSGLLILLVALTSYIGSTCSGQQ
jgi:hypothetical protein